MTGEGAMEQRPEKREGGSAGAVSGKLRGHECKCPPEGGCLEKSTVAGVAGGK